MTFSPEQVSALKAPLSRSHVKQRAQAGRQLSYIEGWHAIAEANRIFGFDSWDRELVTFKELGEPRNVGDKWRVAYMATVRVTVRTKIPVMNSDGNGRIITQRITRDGTGYGSGIDKDLGSAHESAIKEAETDAMKRALMTFGNPFGLALYDKDQANVANGTSADAAGRGGGDLDSRESSPPTRSQPSRRPQPVPVASDPASLIDLIKKSADNEALQAVICLAANIKVYESASETEQDQISEAVQVRRDEFATASLRAG